MKEQKNYITSFVQSKDGTNVRYRQFGEGPGLILVHGGMMAAQNLVKLGERLADAFTIYIPDRRGRDTGQSHSRKGLAAESEDLQALVNKTGAVNIYGLSAGAIVTLQTALLEKSIEKIALHEPPILSTGTIAPLWADNYRAAMEKDNYGRAFIHIVHGTDDPSSLFNILPGFLIAPLMNIAIKKEAKKSQVDSDTISLKALIEAMQYDIQVVKDSAGLVEKASGLKATVLLLRGQKSQSYLKETIDDLRHILPGSTFKEFAGQGHTVSDNGGKPGVVTHELRQFFGS